MLRRSSFVVVFGLAALGACVLPDLDALTGGFVDAGTADAPSTDAADAGDAGATCAVTAPFTSIRALSVGTAADEYAPTLSRDELELWFGRDNVGLHYATRATRDAPFGAVTKSALGDADIADPSLAADGKAIYFIAPGLGGSWDIYRATRTSAQGDFAGPVLLAGIASSTTEILPFPSADQARLYYAASADAGLDLFVATSTGSDFAAPTRIAALSSATNDVGVVVSADELTAYVSSQRTDLGGKGGWDVYRATRARATDPWGPLVNVVELNTAFNERVTWASPDGCRVYFDTTRPGGQGAGDVYVAERYP